MSTKGGLYYEAKGVISAPIYLDNVACYGSEERLTNCTYSTDTSEDSHTDSIWLDCDPNTPTLPPDPNTTLQPVTTLTVSTSKPVTVHSGTDNTTASPPTTGDQTTVVVTVPVIDDSSDNNSSAALVVAVVALIIVIVVVVALVAYNIFCPSKHYKEKPIKR